MLRSLGLLLTWVWRRAALSWGEIKWRQEKRSAPGLHIRHQRGVPARLKHLFIMDLEAIPLDGYPSWEIIANR